VHVSNIYQFFIAFTCKNTRVDVNIIVFLQFRNNILLKCKFQFLSLHSFTLFRHKMVISLSILLKNVHLLAEKTACLAFAADTTVGAMYERGINKNFILIFLFTF
jgi:hypothetical protein